MGRSPGGRSASTAAARRGRDGRDDHGRRVRQDLPGGGGGPAAGRAVNEREHPVDGAAAELSRAPRRPPASRRRPTPPPKPVDPLAGVSAKTRKAFRPCLTKSVGPGSGGTCARLVQKTLKSVALLPVGHLQPHQHRRRQRDPQLPAVPRAEGHRRRHEGHLGGAGDQGARCSRRCCRRSAPRRRASSCASTRRTGSCSGSRTARSSRRSRSGSAAGTTTPRPRSGRSSRPPTAPGRSTTRRSTRRRSSTAGRHALRDDLLPRHVRALLPRLPLAWGTPPPATGA